MNKKSQRKKVGKSKINYNYDVIRQISQFASKFV